MELSIIYDTLGIGHFNRELEVHKEIKHKKIPGFKGVYLEEKSIYLLIELIPLGATQEM